MKKLSILFFSLLALALFMQSCDDNKTYAEMLKEEKKLIQRFIEERGINVITAEQFADQDSTTDISKNQFVLFKDNGVYMQIVNKGKGRVAEDNDVILTRFKEINLSSGDSISTLDYSSMTDEFRFRKNAYQVTATFTNVGGLYQTYGSPSVPAGWLIPLEYVKIPSNAGSDRPVVRVIAPAKMGQSDAIKFTYPCYYELTYQLGF